MRRRRGPGPRRHALPVVVAAALVAGPSLADDDLDAALEAFATDLAGAAASEPPPPERRWRISGRVELDGSYTFDNRLAREYRGLAKLRTEGRLQVDGALPADWKARLGGRAWWDAAYSLRGRGRYPSKVLDDYEFELELWESWLAGALTERLDLKAGRLITSLGTSETLRVVDLLFPVDNREPGQADLEDLLLPLGALRLDWEVLPDWTLLALVFLERRFSELPPPGSSWVPTGPLTDVDDPGHAWHDTEVVLGARGRLGGVDLSVLGASFYGDAPSFRRDPAVPGGLALEHDRLEMLAATAVGARGNWVWRGELAGFHGLEFANDPGETHARVDVLLGLDYFGLPGSALAFDLVHRWIPGAPTGIERAPDFTRRHRTEWALRWRHDLLRERLHLTLVAVALGLHFEDGAIVRIQADYAWSDALTLTGGLLLYGSGDLPPASVLGRNDRVFLGATLRF